MTELEADIFELVEKTTVLVSIDKSKQEEKIWGIDDHVPEEERWPIYAYRLQVDEYNSIGEFSNRLLALEQKFGKYIIKHIEHKFCHVELNSLFDRISINYDLAYKKFDLSTLSGVPFLRQFSKSSGKKYYDPRIIMTVIGGELYQIDMSAFQKLLSVYIARKIEFLKNLNDRIVFYRKKLPSNEAKSISSLQLKELIILDSPRFLNFRNKLIELKLIDDIDIVKFSRCFSGTASIHKINWKESELSLIYLLKKLFNPVNPSKGILEDTKNKWSQVANSFTRKSREINPKKIETSYSKVCKTKSLTDKMDECLKELEKKAPKNPS